MERKLNVTLKDIKSRTVEEGACWIWQRGLTNGQPQMKVQGRDCKLVRRIVLQLVGRAPAPGQPVLVTCENPLCVFHQHLKPSTAGEISQQKAARGAWRGIARAAKISATKRAVGQSKVSDAEVQALRTSSESGPAAAARLGVNRSLISQIRRGVARKDYSSPFIGLLGAAR